MSPAAGVQIGVRTSEDRESGERADEAWLGAEDSEQGIGIGFGLGEGVAGAVAVELEMAERDMGEFVEDHIQESGVDPQTH